MVFESHKFSTKKFSRKCFEHDSTSDPRLPDRTAVIMCGYVFYCYYFAVVQDENELCICEIRHDKGRRKMTMFLVSQYGTFEDASNHLSF